MSAAPIRVITFDVTGTILTFRKPVMQQYAEEAIKFGINANPELLLPCFKAAWGELSKDHPNFGRSTGLGWEEWWRRIVASTFSKYATSKTKKDQVGQLSNHLIKHFSSSKAWTQADECPGVLKSLRNQGFQLGVISNFDPRLHTILKDVDISKYFSFVITSYEAGFEKPDARIFKEVFDMGIKPSEVIHIGNDDVKDVIGAANAGIRSILVSNVKKKIPHSVCSLRDIQKCIDRYNSHKDI